MLFAVVFLAVVCVSLAFLVVRLRVAVQSHRNTLECTNANLIAYKQASWKWCLKYYQMRNIAVKMRYAIYAIDQAACVATDNLEQKIAGIIDGLPAIQNVTEDEEYANETDD